MIKDLIYNGKNLQSFGYVIKRNPGYEVAERDMDFVEIKGDGSALIDNGGYKNVDRTYEVNSFPYWNGHKSTRQLVQEFKDWLYSEYGDYKILRDSYNPGYFCYAIPKQSNLIEYKAAKMLDTSIAFSRKPFWYSDKGTEEIVFEYGTPVASAAITLENPENISSLPYIKVEFSTSGGDLTISKSGAKWSPFTVENITNKIEIDSTTENCHNGSTDMNLNTTADYFPWLTPGENVLNFAATDFLISKITVIPNWRRL